MGTRRAQLRARRVGLPLAGLLLIGLTACALDPIVPPAITVTPAIDSVRALPPEPQPPVLWPLTGVPTDAVAQRPAVAVKVENTRFARPQSGLEDADVVWETVVEFQVSRLVAVFHSRVPDEVGPIRSVRPMDIAIIRPLKGLLTYSGGQSGIIRLARNDSGAQIFSHDAGADGLYRTNYAAAPHNVYGDMGVWLEQADSNHQAPPGEQFVFALRPHLASAVIAGEPATTLSFRLSSAARPSWTWDSGSGLWLRSEDSTAAKSRDGDRLSAVNVVAITARHPDSGFDAQGGAAVPTYDLVGSGEVVVATGGRTIEGTWRKESTAAPLRLFLPDGSPLTLAPGNTWVELIPDGPMVRGSLTVS